MITFLKVMPLIFVMAWVGLNWKFVAWIAFWSNAVHASVVMGNAHGGLVGLGVLSLFGVINLVFRWWCEGRSDW